MVLPQACVSTSELCAALNQFPARNPSCLTPFTRLIPAASSGLSKPASAASCASLRTAASCWLIVLVKRHLVCKRWTIEKADENSNDTPWFALHRPNSDKLRFHLPSL